MKLMYVNERHSIKIFIVFISYYIIYIPYIDIDSYTYIEGRSDRHDSEISL